MNKIEELKFNVEALLHAVKEDKNSLLLSITLWNRYIPY
jgi:hypothetical protein